MIAKCDHCGFVHKFNDTSSIGKTAKCKQCGQPFVVQDGEVPPPIESTNEPEPNQTLIAAIDALRAEVVGLRQDFYSFSDRLPKPIDDSGILPIIKIILLMLCLLGIAALGAREVGGMFSMRFKDDNAVGATANALERMVEQLSTIQSLIGISAFMLFFVAIRFPWSINKPPKPWTPTKPFSKSD